MKIKDITCISDLYYVIGRWFTISILLLMLIALPFALELNDSIFSFLMCASIGFVGTAANYKDDFEYPIHLISALISMLCFIIWIILVNPWFLLILLISLLGLIDKKRWLFWIETSCFISVLVTLIYYNL